MSENQLYAAVISNADIFYTSLSVAGIVAYTFATFIIAWYSKKSVALTKELKKASEAERERNEEFRDQLSDYYQAIVFATIASSAGRGIPNACAFFNNNYKGKIPIVANVADPFAT